MASLLYRLGRFSFHHRWTVLLAWLAVLAAILAGAATLSKPTSDALSIPGTPAQEAIDLLGERFPQLSAGGASARVVFAAPAGRTLTDTALKAAVDRTVADLKGAPQVASVADPYQAKTVNPAGTVGFAQVAYTAAAADLTDAARDGLDNAVTQARKAGLTVEVGGDAVDTPPAAGAGEVIGIVVAAVVLFITFGSLIAAGLPLLTAIIGIAIGVGGITASTHFFDLSGTTSTLALMLGLAVAVDYALFVVSRYRQELTDGRPPREAAGRAIGTAGSAVVFAGLTVVIALAGLSVVGIPFLTQMGVAAAATVAVAVLIALTLLPALLGFAGPRVARGRNRAVGGKSTMGNRWVRAIVRRPVVALVAALLGLGIVAIPALDLRLGMFNDGTAAPDSTQRKAYDLLAGGFGDGFNAPLTVVVDTDGGTAVQPAAARVGDQIKSLHSVAAVNPAVPNRAGDTAIITVIPTAGPDDQSTEQLVHDIRDLDVTGAQIGVTGATAVNVDISEKVGGALLPYLALVVGLAFILLMLVFRSLLVPLKATLGFLLSVAATFGAIVAIFQWGWLAGPLGITSTGPIVSFLPILLIGIVFGLAMDYQVFLVTRMREAYVHGANPRDAIVTGFGHSARVVTAAALIMMSVFLGFLLSPEATIKSIGVGLGLAVLFDAIVVRMTLVPAVMSLLDRAAWWLPRWLDRALPDLDIEGEKLRHIVDRKPAPEPIPETVPNRR